jgi:hypothetical protein
MTSQERAVLIRQAIRQQLTPPAAKTTCDACHSRYTGTAKCPCQALRKITYVIAGKQVTGNYCVKHALELSAKGERGELEILSDEAAGIPFEGEPLHNKEITSRDYYGI